MFVQLWENCTNVEMSISLCFWSLQSALNGQCSLQKVKGSSHFTNSSIITCHIVKCHCLSQFIVFTQFFRLFQQVQCTINVFLLQVVYCKNITDFTKLFARFCELLWICSHVCFLNFEQFLQHTNGFNVFRFRLILFDGIFKPGNFCLQILINFLDVIKVHFLFKTYLIYIFQK